MTRLCEKLGSLHADLTPPSRNTSWFLLSDFLLYSMGFFFEKKEFESHLFLSTQQTGVYQNSSGTAIGRKLGPRISSKKQWIQLTVLVTIFFFKIYYSIRSRTWSHLIFWLEYQNSAAANSDQIKVKKTQIKKKMEVHTYFHWRFSSPSIGIFAGELLHRNSGRKRRWIQKLVQRYPT